MSSSIWYTEDPDESLEQEIQALNSLEREYRRSQGVRELFLFAIGYLSGTAATATIIILWFFW